MADHTYTMFAGYEVDAQSMKEIMLKVYGEDFGIPEEHSGKIAGIYAHIANCPQAIISDAWQEYLVYLDKAGALDDDELLDMLSSIFKLDDTHKVLFYNPSAKETLTFTGTRIEMFHLSNITKAPISLN